LIFDFSLTIDSWCDYCSRTNFRIEMTAAINAQTINRDQVVQFQLIHTLHLFKSGNTQTHTKQTHRQRDRQTKKQRNQKRQQT